MTTALMKLAFGTDDISASCPTLWVDDTTVHADPRPGYASRQTGEILGAVAYSQPVVLRTADGGVQSALWSIGFISGSADPQKVAAPPEPLTPGVYALLPVVESTTEDGRTIGLGRRGQVVRISDLPGRKGGHGGRS